MDPSPSIVNSIFIPTNIVGNEEKLSNEQRLRQSGRIPYFTFQFIIGAFFAVAVLAVTARTIIRIRMRRFGLDDYFVLLAITTLSGATGVTMKYTRDLFLVEAMTRNPAYIFTIEDLKSLGSVVHIIVCFPPMTWTATFAIKVSFLVLFRQVTKRISKRITIYIWFVMLLTVLTWAFALSQDFVGCPYMNDPKLCAAFLTSMHPLILDATLVSLDMATDVMIVIIPILILRMSKMKFTQKLGLAALLCLSIFMVLISAIRMTGYAHHHGLIDVTWSWLCIHIEACVAIIMASISAFSPFIFINRNHVKKADVKKARNQVPSPLDQERVLENSKSPNRAGCGEMGREGLPAAPLATLTRIHRFLYEDARLTEVTQTMQSTSCSGDEESQSYVLSPSTNE